jgi:L-arabonate dehydrase
MVCPGCCDGGPAWFWEELALSSETRTYRSAEWFEAGGVDGFLQRTAMKVQGFSENDFTGKPVVGIANNWSELTRCHLHFRGLVEAVKRGVWQAGGFPLEFPTLTMGADLARPVGISFMHRNLMAMEVEQTIRAYPVDSVVMFGACDETIPGMLLAAVSTDIPTVMLPGGPGLNGKWCGEDVGSSTDTHRLYMEYRDGRMSAADWRQLESHIERSPGHCMTMGTASTMACIAEALGIAPTTAAAIPAVDSNRLRLAQYIGHRAVEIAEQDIRPSRILTDAAFENAIRVLSSVAGSTNAVIHLVAIARRLGLDLPLTAFDRISRETPVLVNLKPAGKYLMEDFYYAGGVPALLSQLAPLLRLDAETITGATVGETMKGLSVVNSEVIRSIDTALAPEGGIVVLQGNLAPNGAILKQTAASADLLVHEGRAVVFEDHDDLAARLDDPDLDVGPDDVIVLKYGGPRGAPGMPEWGSIPLPRKVLATGARDMVRISDSRMSGTAFGTAVLHISPEAAVGGPLAIVRSGDIISLDTPNRRLEVRISDEEIARRLAEWQPRATGPKRGYTRLYIDHVNQTHEGCDFDFLEGRSPVADERSIPISGEPVL